MQNDPVDEKAELLALQAEIQREELEIFALTELKAEREKEARFVQTVLKSSSLTVLTRLEHWLLTYKRATRQKKPCQAKAAIAKRARAPQLHHQLCMLQLRYKSLLLLLQYRARSLHPP